MQTFDINLTAVLVASVAYMIIGFLWYSPMLFGKSWVKASGMNKKGMGPTYLASFITVFITSYVLAHFIDLADAESPKAALQAAFWIWLGFMATKSLSGVLWKGEPIQLYAINVAYDLVGLGVASLILTMWD